MAFLLLNIVALDRNIDHFSALRRLQSIRWIALMDGNESNAWSFGNETVENLLAWRKNHLRNEIRTIWRDARLSIRLIPAERVAHSWLEMPWGALMDHCNKCLNCATAFPDEGAKQDAQWAESRPPQDGHVTLHTLLTAQTGRATLGATLGTLGPTGRARSGAHPGNASPRAAGGCAGGTGGTCDAPPPKKMAAPGKKKSAWVAKAPAEGPAKASPTSPHPWPALYVPHHPVAAEPTAPPPGHGAPAGGRDEGQGVAKHAGPAASARPFASSRAGVAARLANAAQDVLRGLQSARPSDLELPLACNLVPEPKSAMNVDREGPAEPEVEPAAAEAADAVPSAMQPSPEAAGAAGDTDEFVGSLEEGHAFEADWSPDNASVSPEEDENPEQQSSSEEDDPRPGEARLSHTAARPSHRARACLMT